MHPLMKVFPAVLAIFTAASPALPHGAPPLRGTVNVEVLADGGHPFPVYPHRSYRKANTAVMKQYLEARAGENYSIVIRNNTDERVGVVIAVDGRNIISGDRSELLRTESMYVVDAGTTGIYEGWRTSRVQVHRFFFTTSAASYSVRTFGDSSATGLIAAAVFRDRDRCLPAGKKQESMTAPAAGRSSKDASGPAAEQRAGTGFGSGSYAPALTVAFSPERFPVQTTLIKYAWREALCEQGIIRCEEPGNRLWDDARYAPYPPGY
jgi:hypothetical protein